MLQSIMKDVYPQRNYFSTSSSPILNLKCNILINNTHQKNQAREFKNLNIGTGHEYEHEYKKLYIKKSMNLN